MAQARDVAQYILSRYGALPAMKLQKLLYYCQAWSLVWDGKPLFPEPIEAWANGPVVRDVWAANRGVYVVREVPGSRPMRVGPRSASTINRVIDHYGKKDASDLSELTHIELPWREARSRSGVKPGSPSDEIISIETMKKYYNELANLQHA